MEIEQKKEIALVKKFTSYKIIIPSEVERLIRFLCERVWDTEWSGVLFYTPSGNFEDGSLEIRCVDILPMDIGTTTYTEFDMSPDVISYMAQNPELLDCKMGLIHSHNNMATFFSGTDLDTLKEEGVDRNHFVSLIVNNAGKYTAAITRKIKYKSVRELSYEGFNGTVSLKDKEETEGEEIEYFNLDIVFEEEKENWFSEVADRLKEIKENKAKVAPKQSAPYNSGPYPYKATFPTYGSVSAYGGYIKKEEKETKQPTLFDDLDWGWSSKPISKVTTSKKEEDDPVAKKVTDAIIDEIMVQLITGSVTITKLDKETYDKALKTLDIRFGKRFHNNPKLFSYWAVDFVEFLLWYTIDDPDLDECEVATQIANKVIMRLEKLPKSEYIDEYINAIISYADRI